MKPVPLNPRDTWIVLRRTLRAFAHANPNIIVAPQFTRVAMVNLDKQFGSRAERLVFLSLIFDRTITSSKDLTRGEQGAIVTWLAPSLQNKWGVCPLAQRNLDAITPIIHDVQEATHDTQNQDSTTPA